MAQRDAHTKTLLHTRTYRNLNAELGREILVMAEPGAALQTALIN